jgi:nucleoside-diphosphate-sugar epimerase
MKIVILGNMGYVGSVVTQHLRKTYPTATLVGFDTGFFSSCLTDAAYLPERELNHQHFGDVRNFPDEILVDADAVINLAAISNDPMGQRFEKVTMEINYKACIEIATRARALGVTSFIYASSCSVYGITKGKAFETSNVNPLTTYARSKVYAERDLRLLANDDFTITCLRFSTACGMSPRLRLDLVLNDFVACALASHQISILSDGTPWRPLINVNDMAIAIEWAIGRSTSPGAFMAINVGSEEWNYQVKQLAEAVASVIPGTSIDINKSAVSDKRSYEVDFTLFKILAPNHQPENTLISTINDLKAGLEAIKFNDVDFRNSNLIRLKTLASLRENEQVTDDLRWIFEQQPKLIAL